MNHKKQSKIWGILTIICLFISIPFLGGSIFLFFTDEYKIKMTLFEVFMGIGITFGILACISSIVFAFRKKEKNLLKGEKNEK